MEVSRQSGSCGCQFRGLHDVGTLHRLLTPSRHQPSLSHVISSKSPSRDSPTTDFSSKSRDIGNTTLEGVLRGQVPSIFTNLYRNTPGEEDYVVRTKVFTSPASPVVSNTNIASVSSPKPSTSPVVTPYTLKRTYSQLQQEEPIDLSCKKMRSDMVHARVDISPVESCMDVPSVLPSYPDNSPSPRSHMALPGHKGPSLLRNLLCLGKDLDTSQYIVNSDNSYRNINGHSSGILHQRLTNSSSSIDSQNSLSRLLAQNDGCVKNNSGASGPSTKVTLAKKNMLPVSARVSDWLVKIIRFAKSIPEFMSLLHNDKLALILNSWARLLLLYMAENNFQFAVTPDLLDQSPPVQCQDSGAQQGSPTMKSVESIQSFIRKCQNMGTDSKEYAFLRMAVLFNAGIRGLDRPDMVDRVNSSVQQLLQQHVQASRPRDYMHYSRLLMSLPALYGINCKMIENLFCRHINGNMDMDVLLKEMLQNI